MAKTYRVWIEVEEHDDETDEYTDVYLDFGSEEVFETEEEAVAYAHKMHQAVEPDISVQ